MAGIYDNFTADVKKDAQKVEDKLDTTEGRKWVKYAVYIMLGLVLVLFGSCVLQSMYAPRVMVHPLEYTSVQPQVQYTSISK